VIGLKIPCPIQTLMTLKGSDNVNQQEKIRIGVLFGGRSGEHEVSLMSARSVLSVLNPDKYAVTQIGITHDGQWFSGENALDALASGNTSSLTHVTLLPEPGDNTLYAMRGTAQTAQLEPLTSLDVVFPVLHGSFGEDGTLQGLLEMAGLAYVGAGVLGSSVCMDKALFKDLLTAHNLPTPAYRVFQRSAVKNNMDRVIEKVEQIGAYPLFVKPANMGSSVGVSKANGRSDLMEGLLEACRFDRRVLVEKGINAREIEVSVLGNDNPQASIPGEILPSREFYSYEAKYIDDRSELLIPAPLDAEALQFIREIAVKVYQVADCAGMARVDFLLDKNTGEVYVNEVNTIPGFTRISMYPKLWEASGLSYANLVDQLVELAFERKAERDQTEYQYGRVE